MKHRLKTFVKLVVGTSVTMYLANKWIESSALIHKLLKTDAGKFYNWRHGKIYYTKSGSGSPVLLIHDLHPASSCQEWASVIQSLSEKHTVYALDLLACGRSDKPGYTYTNYLYVQLVNDFIRDVVGEKADILSSGRSCSFVVMAAKMYPDLCGKLTLISPESFGKLSVIPNTGSKILKAVFRCPILGVFIYYLLTSRNQLEYNFMETYFYNPFRLNSNILYTYYESAHTHRGAGRYLMASINGHYLNTNIRPAFSELKNDIQLILGSEMPYAQEIAASYKKANENVTCRFVEKAKALPHLETPDHISL